MRRHVLFHAAFILAQIQGHYGTIEMAMAVRGICVLNTPEALVVGPRVNTFIKEAMINFTCTLSGRSQINNMPAFLYSYPIIFSFENWRNNLIFKACFTGYVINYP